MDSLRALLIRIGVKPEPCGLCSGSSLRALLIRIGVKLHYPAELYGKFESLVNSDRCQTRERLQTFDQRFESLVNSDRCQTMISIDTKYLKFESLVNSDRCQT